MTSNYLQSKKKSARVNMFNHFFMTEKFIPAIKKAEDVSKIHETLDRRSIAQHDRSDFLNKIIA